MCWPGWGLSKYFYFAGVGVRILKNLVCVLVLTGLIGNSYGAHFCTGKIEKVYVSNNGSVFIMGSWRNAHTKLCQVGLAWKEIESEVCNLWLSVAQVAYASKSLVTLRYDDVESCSSIPTYGTAPPPEYLMLDGN